VAQKTFNLRYYNITNLFIININFIASEIHVYQSHFSDVSELYINIRVKKSRQSRNLVSVDEFLNGWNRTGCSSFSSLCIAVLLNVLNPKFEFIYQLIELSTFQQQVFEFQTTPVQCYLGVFTPVAQLCR
jgi:hypothetical protein